MPRSKPKTRRRTDHDEAMEAVRIRAEALHAGPELDTMVHRYIMGAFEGAAPPYSTDDATAMRMLVPLGQLLQGRNADVSALWRPGPETNGGVPYFGVSLLHPGPYWHHCAQAKAATLALAMCRAAMMAIWQQMECRYNEHRASTWLPTATPSCRHRHAHPATGLEPELARGGTANA